MIGYKFCKNCSHKVSGNFCKYCGQKTEVVRLNPETVINELITLFFNSTNDLGFTFRQLLFNPGRTMLEYIDGARKKYQGPISYFVCSITIYFLYAKFIIPSLGMTKEDIGNGLTLDLNHLFILLSGMSFIGWIVCGLKWGISDKRTFNFIESVVVFSFIYGTNFFLDPIVISIETLFWKDIISFVGKENIKLVTDIPLIILIAYMAFDFCQKSKISKLRYFITLILGFLYYYYMSNFIEHVLINIKQIK